MRLKVFKLYLLMFLLAEIDAAGIGEAWQVPPYSTDYWNYPSWPRSDSSAFEVRTVSGFGHLNPLETSQKSFNLDQNETNKPNDVSKKESHNDFQSLLQNPSYNQYSNHPDTNDATIKDKRFNAGMVMAVLQPNDKDVTEETKKVSSRLRRDAENETNLEQISTTKNVREVRLSSSDSWSTQPVSIEFPRRSSLDQIIQTADNEDLPNGRSYQAPRAEFVTSHHRRSYDHREARDMPVTRGYDEYDYSWYRNGIRERDYDPMPYHRGFGYYYPDRYRTEREYYMRLPNDYSYYHDRYRDEDLDLYGRSRPTPKPKRIIYYATLPEVVRKPVDLRNYPRPYDGTRSPASRDGTYKRIPGNVDPTRYRYRNLYDGYDSYSKRSSFVDRSYPYSEEDSRRKENLRNDQFDQNNDRKIGNQMLNRNEGKLPWPVQIGTEVSVKDDDRISGRKVFGENNGYERFQSAQLQKAPDATGSSELQSDN